jgi:gas vesicle protein
MTSRYDDIDRHEGGGVLGAFICGALTGAAIAILFAPGSGRDTRERLYSKAREFADSRDAVLERLEAQLNAWSGTIDALAARAQDLTVEARTELERQLGDLHARRETAERILHDLQNTGGEAWRELATAADRAWQELRRGVDSASAWFS